MTRDPTIGWTRGLDDGPEIHVQGFRGSFQRDRLIERILELRETHEAVLQVFDPAAIYGTGHLIAAAEKALRSHQDERAIARDLATEIACYAAGTDQISTALETVGLPAQGDALVAVGLGETGKAALDELGKDAFEPADDLPGQPETALDRLGLLPGMRESVPEARWGLLVVEHVALLDARR